MTLYLKAQQYITLNVITKVLHKGSDTKFTILKAL